MPTLIDVSNFSLCSPCINSEIFYFLITIFIILLRSNMENLRIEKTKNISYFLNIENYKNFKKFRQYFKNNFQSIKNVQRFISVREIERRKWTKGRKQRKREKLSSFRNFRDQEFQSIYIYKTLIVKHPVQFKRVMRARDKGGSSSRRRN